MLNFDPTKYAYPSRRNVVYAPRAMACTSVPLGAQIGIDVMKSGGNAMDAAVAMAAAMPLLEPTGNGLGSDCFALIWVEKEKKLEHAVLELKDRFGKNCMLRAIDLEEGATARERNKLIGGHNE